MGPLSPLRDSCELQVLLHPRGLLEEIGCEATKSYKRVYDLAASKPVGRFFIKSWVD